MKVTVERAELLKSLSHVHRVVERRNTIPILANVLIRTGTNGLSLKATDLDLEVVETVPAEVAQDGATTVPAHVLYDIVRKLPDGAQVLLEAGGERGSLAVRAGRARFTLQTLPETDFPDLAPGDFSHAFKVKGADFRRLVDKTQFAISTEETRYYLNGINLQSDGDHIVAASTDGHRLGRIRRAAAGAEAFLKAGPESCIIRRRAIVAAVALLRGPVTIHLSKHRIEMSCPVGVVTSTLIDGTFPAYGKLIPDHGACGYEADRKALLSAVAKLSAVSDGQDGMSLAWDGRQLVGEVTIGVHGIGGRVPVSGSGALTTWPKTSLGISRRYLASIASVLRGAALQITAGAQRHAPFVISDPSDSDVLFLLMSMTVDAAKRHVAPSAQVGTLEAAE